VPSGRGEHENSEYGGKPDEVEKVPATGSQRLHEPVAGREDRDDRNVVISGQIACLTWGTGATGRGPATWYVRVSLSHLRG